MDAYLGFMARDDGVYRLVFESDLVNLPAVRDRMESVNAECAQLVSQVIAEDTGLSAEESTLLAFGLIGLAQTAARQWLRNPHTIARPDAGSLLASLAWRGISGFPKNPNPDQ